MTGTERELLRDGVLATQTVDASHLMKEQITQPVTLDKHSNPKHLTTGLKGNSGYHGSIQFRTVKLTVWHHCMGARSCGQQRQMTHSQLFCQKLYWKTDFKSLTSAQIVTELMTSKAKNVEEAWQKGSKCFSFPQCPSFKQSLFKLPSTASCRSTHITRFVGFLVVDASPHSGIHGLPVDLAHLCLGQGDVVDAWELNLSIECVVSIRRTTSHPQLRALHKQRNWSHETTPFEHLI